MERIAGIIVGHSKRILAATVLVTLVSLVMFLRMDFNADVSSFILEGSEVGEEFVDLQDKYATADPINVVVTLDGEATFADRDALVALVGLRDEILALDDVRFVATIVPDVNPLTGDAVTVDTVRAIPEAAIGQLLAANPTSELLLSNDRRSTLLMVTPDDGTALARRLVDLEAPPGTELVVSGNPIVFAEVTDRMSWFLVVIPPVVVALLIGTFFATIGDRRLSILAMIPALLGSIWTFGTIFGLGREVDIVTVIVPIFVIVMGSADGLHFVTHFQEEAGLTADRVARVASALRHVGVPMILTTISTAAGFLSLAATDVRPIQQMGIFTAVGITFAGIISFFSLPAILSRITVESRHHHALIGPRILGALKTLVRTRVPAVALSIGLVAFAGVGIPRLEVDADQLFFFKDDDPVRLAFETTEDLFGGATPLIGEFRYDPGAGTEQLDALATVTTEMEALTGVRTVFSLVDMAAQLPPDQADAAFAGDLALPVGDMVSDDGLRFMLLPADFSNDDLQGWLDYADETDEVRVLTGMPVIWDEIARLVLRAQFVSIAAAFVLVATMLMIAYRRVRETLVSLVPVALTVATLLAFIAISGIQLNLVTAIVSSIVIGVGIDYTIHFVAAIDHARHDGPGYVYRAIDRAGRPIVANALGIAIGLSALWLSPFAIHPSISQLMWVAMTVAALTAIVLISALLPRAGVADRP